LLLDFANLLPSDEFTRRARHPDFPKAFTRDSKLPLPALVAALISMRSGSQQVSLDEFFASTLGESAPVRVITDRGFDKARKKLHVPALEWLNERLLDLATQAHLIPLWCGFRVVAADGSTLQPAVRACHRTRSAAAANQILFGMYLPGAELMLHASVHPSAFGERAMLIEALEHLGPNDVLVLDRGYPASWLIQFLIERGIRFVIRCDNDSGWAAVRSFVRSNEMDAQVTLSPPSADDALEWECARVAPTVRLVKSITHEGKVRAMVTNLTPEQVPTACFAELYHQRWRIEEAYKRLKHVLHLESVSGLSQQALIIDVAAKVLADNLASLMCLTAEKIHNMHARKRFCNRRYAARALTRVLPSVLTMIGDVLLTIADAIANLARNHCRHTPGRSTPRPEHHVKPHPRYAYKG
jgi:hypothetical protein